MNIIRSAVPNLRSSVYSVTQLLAAEALMVRLNWDRQRGDNWIVYHWGTKVNP